ncbi:CLUMA_CG010634, isoform A [Clunio marinus]|uniref:CLUMA_CG010634, isoform A n=1 Tax=Clunio marinus TaxID=568069 RepID=A0A1J1IE08_9DIPT|nr:CLUMA_CG010634, isoform A [Clunio marinus]
MPTTLFTFICTHILFDIFLVLSVTTTRKATKQPQKIVHKKFTSGNVFSFLVFIRIGKIVSKMGREICFIPPIHKQIDIV